MAIFTVSYVISAIQELDRGTYVLYEMWQLSGGNTKAADLREY